MVLFFTSTSAVSKLPSVDRMVWLLADLCVVVMLVPWHRDFLDLSRKAWILLTGPTMAIASFIWSLTPSLSLYHGVQLLTTVLVGFLLAIFARIERLVPLVFTAILASGVLSIAYVLVNPADGLALHGEWQGLFAHKNTTGTAMSLLVIAAGCLFLQGWRPFLTAGAVALAVALLLLSRSGTSIVALAVTLCIAPVFVIARKGFVLSALGLGLVLVVAAGGLLMLEAAHIDLVPAVLGALGKDETLTGRTVLWDVAVDAYESRPLLGFGYKAWWSSYETDAAIIVYLIGNDAGNFHNSLIEMAVAFGTFGPILLGGSLLYSLITAIRVYAVDGRFLLLWPVLTTLYIILSCFAESLLFNNHGFYQLLLVVAAAAASRRLSELRAEKRAEAASPST
jgi:O-antigen ligase